MELEQICITGINNTYAISNVKKEFRKAVEEPWKEEPLWKRYQKKLIVEDGLIILLTAFLEKNDRDYQRAINVAQKRLEWLESKVELWRIGRWELQKN